jgi:hypothetical protein
VETRQRVKLFVVGVLIGVSMFVVGGIGVVPSPTPEPTAELQPWLQKTVCDYPVVDCTSRGAVVTSSAHAHIPSAPSR